MSEELATVRDLIGVGIPFVFNVNKKNILLEIQYNNYVKSKPIYKSELKNRQSYLDCLLKKYYSLIGFIVGNKRTSRIE